MKSFDDAAAYSLNSPGRTDLHPNKKILERSVTSNESAGCNSDWTYSQQWLWNAMIIDNNLFRSTIRWSDITWNFQIFQNFKNVANTGGGET